VTGKIRHPSVRQVTADGRRWYRIAAAVTTVVAVAALTLGACGQLFAPAVAPFTTKAVLAQDAGAQDSGPQAAADDAPRRCGRAVSGGRPARTRPPARCRPARPKAGRPAGGRSPAGHRVIGTISGKDWPRWKNPR